MTASARFFLAVSRGYNVGVDQESKDLRLSRISTLWSLVCEAHGGTGAARTAQEKLLERYGGAVRRYLLGAVRDPDTADELFQEFAVRFLNGNLAGADPERGQFRGFVKGVLFHLVADFYKRRQRHTPLPADTPEPMAGPPSLLDSEREFLTSWRDELLARSWAALKDGEQHTGQPWFTVLRFRADHPEMRSQHMAEALSRSMGKPLSAAGVRQMLHRARDKFTELLLDEIVQSLSEPTQERIDQELIELGLAEYCRPAANRQGRAAPP